MHFEGPVSLSRVVSRCTAVTDRSLSYSRQTDASGWSAPPTGSGIIAIRRFPEINYGARHTIYAAEPQHHVLLTVSQNGMVSFPKGGMKTGDSDFILTVHREFREESGLRLTRLLHQTNSGGDQPSRHQRNCRYLVALCSEPQRNVD